MALSYIYNNFYLKTFNLEKIKAELELAKAQNQTTEVSEQVNFVLETASVTGFPAPITIGNQVFVDSRPFTTINRDGKLQIRNVIESNFRIEQARWELVNTNGSERYIMLPLIEPHYDVYSKWIVDIIGHNYGLNPYQRLQIQALASLYAYSQTDNTILMADDTAQLKRQIAISKDLGIHLNIYESVTGNTDNLFPKDLNEFIETIKLASISTRLDNFSREALNQAASSSFFGISFDKITSCLALDNPSVLLTIIHTCLNNNNFNKTRLGVIVKNNSVYRNADKFNRSYMQLLNKFSNDKRLEV